MMTLREHFALNVRKARACLGISQEQLALSCGLHRTYISDIERGVRNVSIDNIEKIALALNVLPDSLLKKEDNYVNY